MNVICVDDQHDMSLALSQVRRLSVCVLAEHHVRCSDLLIHFVNKARSSALHQQFFGDPSPTDCMSFPIDLPQEEGGVLGEIVICPAFAVDDTLSIATGSEALSSPYEELSLLIVHSLLHLLGFKDQSSSEIQQIREEEQRLLNLIDKRGLMLATPELVHPDSSAGSPRG